MEHVSSANVGLTQLPPSKKVQVSQVDLLPRFHNTTPSGVGVPSMKHFVQDSIPGPLSGTLELYHGMPLDVQPLQMESSPFFESPVSAYPSFPDPRMNRKYNPEFFPTFSSTFSNSGKVRASVPISREGVQKLLAANKRPPPSEPPLKSQAESSDSTRAKLRESLAAALAMVSHDSVENVKASPEKVETSEQTRKSDSFVTITSGNETSENEKEETQSSSFDENPKFISASPKVEQLESDDLVLKDELLQGHGLCWVSDVFDHVEAKTDHVLKRPKLSLSQLPKDAEGASLSDCLASKIELEFFKLHGGVNKKYKERGRSLLFNLKDRNNPELRERVMSGDIAPERLCSMTAEELASKELSQWRLTKAQEFAEMVVLPDSEVDMRRLVKKTHKGEIQVVEAEQDDTVSVEVGLGATMIIPQVPKRANEVEQPGKSSGKSPKTNVDEENKTADNLDSKNDLMQELMAHEIKDTELLPPIVSLDEFMEALDSEPPFENLPLDCKAKDVPEAGEEHLGTLKLEAVAEPGNIEPKKSITSDRQVVSAKFLRPPAPSPSEVEYERVSIEGDRLGVGSRSPDAVSKGDNLWEGLIQFNLSCVAAVHGVYKSGEKTSTKDWPSLVEIKGRVRVDALGKFLKELPLSKTRAVMILHFDWKEEKSAESSRLNLSEVAKAYIADERVGYAQPAPGMELYLCPSHSQTAESLVRHLPEEHAAVFRPADTCLVAVVVWRRPRALTSPTPTSHRKHGCSNSKRQSSKKHKSNGNGNVLRSKAPEEAADEVPPGFGPDAIEDDLLEFNFVSSKSKSHVSPPAPALSRPVEQMRELIQKYGQDDGVVKPGLKIQPWNDDDDIPEWQPPGETLPTPLPPRLPLLNALQQQALQMQILNQGVGPLQPHFWPPVAPPPRPHAGGEMPASGGGEVRTAAPQLYGGISAPPPPPVLGARVTGWGQQRS